MQKHEFEAYVDVFTHSANRVQRMIYVVTIVTALLFLASWNTADQSWARARIDEFNKKGGAHAIKPARAEWLHEYVRQYGTRMMMVQIPLIGIMTDANELGLFGGIALALMMFLLLLALARMHENLYLSTFRVRTLLEEDDNPDVRESRANLLYHTLAMSQVLNSPPTLARWKARPLVRPTIKILVFLLPAAWQAWIFIANLMEMGTAKEAFHSTAYWRLGLQGVTACIVLALAILCALHVHACEQRWRESFFLINPRQQGRTPPDWMEWLKLREPRLKSPEERMIVKKLADEMANTVAVPPPVSTSSGAISLLHVIPEEKRKERDHVTALQMTRHARDEVRKWCNANQKDDARLADCAVEEVKACEETAKVRVAWTFQYVDTPPRLQIKKQP